MTTTDDLLAIRREYALNGRDAAVAEIRQQSPMIDENGVEAILYRILMAPIILPDVRRAAAYVEVRPQEQEPQAMIDPADTIAIKRAFETAGRDGALAELRRRFPVVNAERAASALDHILALPVEAPEARRGDRRRFPGPQGRPRKRRE